MTRRLLPIIVVALVAAGCGDDDAVITTTTAAVTSTVAPTSTTEATTTTVDTGPLAALAGRPIQDTLLDTGFHEMQYGDDTHTWLVSVDSLTGPDAAVDRLAVASVDPPPVTTGIAADQALLMVWIDNWQGDVAPTGIALFRLGPEGWTADISVGADAVLSFLDTTTDYGARRPDGPPVLQMLVTRFDAPSHFTAGVSVFDLLLPDTGAAFEGQIECDVVLGLVCTLLSDDGVLRRGDTGSAVTDIQDSLILIGYLTGPASGTYDEATEDAVFAFQRDYRLGRDGRAGPQTLGMLGRVTSGTSGIIMASRFGIGPVLFGTDSLTAWLDLIDLLGTPVDTGWYTDGCDGHQWYKSSWNGFTAIFTDRDVVGLPEFDGWEVTDLSNVPATVYFVGGFRPGSTWAYARGLGAHWDPDYAVFDLTDFGYPNGRFFESFGPGGTPPDGAFVRGFGTGTGGFVSC